MKKITLTITVLVTEDGYEDKIDSVLDEYAIIPPNMYYVEPKNTYKLTNAIDNKFVEIVSTQVKVEQANIN